jgi:NAD dependent epimerase/dehydratase family enzyme
VGGCERGDTDTVDGICRPRSVAPEQQVPATALRLAFGELSDVLMSSQRVMPQVATRAGYRFAYPELDGALTAIYAPQAKEEVA